MLSELEDNILLTIWSFWHSSVYDFAWKVTRIPSVWFRLL